jgi:hypothetical protein
MCVEQANVFEQHPGLSTARCWAAGYAAGFSRETFVRSTPPRLFDVIMKFQMRHT